MIHRYMDDINRMATMGLSSFRFSISWSRVMSWNGKEMIPNGKGIAFYRAMIAALHEKHIEPVLTMYHWDLPLELHTTLSPPGWLHPSIVQHYTTYATLLFAEFGKEVSFWATFNEPWTFAFKGYGIGDHAPGMSNSTTNAYLAAHHLLLSHASAVSVFRQLQTEGGVQPKARISIVLNCDYGFPLNATSSRDIATADRKMEFSLGWFLNPIVHGDYPDIMKEYAGSHLPVFTKDESTLLKGSYDLLMLNHYSSQVVTDCDSPTSERSCDSLTLGW